MAAKSQEQFQFETAMKRARERWGWQGWQTLGPELRQAMVRAEVLAQINMGAAFEDSFAGRVAQLAFTYDGAD